MGPLFPISNYGAMKLASEAALSAALESFLRRVWIFRFPNVVGSRATHGAIAPFPGGVCRSPSKPGSKYKNVRASTNAAFCPTLRGRVETQLNAEAEAAYELVIDGLTETIVRQAMAAAILAACRPGVLRITAGNYGGTLGPYHLYLHKILQEAGF